MLFNTLDFVIFFIFIIVILISIKNRKFQHSFLLAASYFFFYYSSGYLILLLIFSTFLDFYAGKKIWECKDNPTKKKIILITSLAGNLGLLGFYKYADFAILQFNLFGEYFDLSNQIPFLNLALPIGISFYTFQTISYTIDVYRGNLEPSKSIKEFGLFVAFFPQLVAGPILRASHFLPQLREKIEQFSSKTRLTSISINSWNLKLGISIMALGFLKKMFFADNISPFVDQVFSNPMGLESASIILGTIGFGIQIYADFSGYSDIAIGAAIILGFKIPRNFNKPYFASSPRDFWQRWHISLSTWLRDYLYIPLGGNKISKSRTFLNLIIVMLLGGLWHGASWNFVIWGLLHGVYLSIHRVVQKSFPGISNNKFLKSKLGLILSILVTQYFVFLAWIPFRVRNFDFMIYSMEKYLFFDFIFQETVDIVLTNKISIFLMAVFILFNYLSYRSKNFYERIAKMHLFYWGLMLFSIMISILILYDGHPENFIYFKF